MIHSLQHLLQIQELPHYSRLHTDNYITNKLTQGYHTETSLNGVYKQQAMWNIHLIVLFLDVTANFFQHLQHIGNKISHHSDIVKIIDNKV
jgi:hypothetical protein